jgi:hypothetical protein
MGSLDGRCKSPWRFSKFRIVPAHAYAVRNAEPVSTARKPLPDYKKGQDFSERVSNLPARLESGQ